MPLVDGRGRPPDLRIGIVSYQTETELRRCLEGLAPAVGDLVAEVVVVDNASTDGSVEAARSIPGLRVVANSVNVGYASAMNQALGCSGAPFLLALNPDTELTPGSIATMVEHLSRAPEVGLLSPGLIWPDGRPQHCVHRFPSPAVALVTGLVPHRARAGAVGRRFWLEGYSDLDRPADVDWTIGAVHLIRAAALLPGEPVYDERSFMYAEDLEICWRLRRRGWLIRYDPTVRVVHVGNAAGARTFGSAREDRWLDATYDWYVHDRGRPAARGWAAANAIGLAAKRLALTGERSGRRDAVDHLLRFHASRVREPAGDRHSRHAPARHAATAARAPNPAAPERRPVLLCVSAHTPSANAPHAGAVVLHHRLTSLARTFDVVVVLPDKPGEGDDAAPGDPPWRVLLVPPDPTGPGWPGWHKLLPAAAGALDLFTVKVTRAFRDPPGDLAAVLADAAAVELQWGEYAPLVPLVRRWAPQAAVGLYLHDVLSSVRAARSRNPMVRWQERLIYRVSGPQATWRERRLVRATDVTFVLKDSDVPLVQGRDGRPVVHVAQPWLDLPDPPPGPAREPVAVFVSALWREENAAGARWLLDEVWPAVHRQVPGAVLRVVGSGAPDWLLARSDETAGIEVPGFVDDLAAVYRGARVTLAPLTDPSGIKIKVLQSIAYGIPVAATPAAVAGMPTAPRDAFAAVSDSPTGFAAGVAAALESWDHARATGTRAAAWVRTAFDPELDVTWAADYYLATHRSRLPAETAVVTP